MLRRPPPHLQITLLSKQSFYSDFRMSVDIHVFAKLAREELLDDIIQRLADDVSWNGKGEDCKSKVY